MLTCQGLILSFVKDVISLDCQYFVSQSFAPPTPFQRKLISPQWAKMAVQMFGSFLN